MFMLQPLDPPASKERLQDFYPFPTAAGPILISPPVQNEGQSGLGPSSSFNASFGKKHLGFSQLAMGGTDSIPPPPQIYILNDIYPGSSGLFAV